MTVFGMYSVPATFMPGHLSVILFYLPFIMMPALVMLLQGWLDDAPETVDDPSVEQPEDWDEEEDGEWEAPQA